MKESKILKIISYIALPIVVFILILSSFYTLMYSNYNYESKKEYFESTEFAQNVESAIEDLAQELIYAKENSYRKIFKDGENRIFEVTGNAPNLWEVKNNYFLLIYENKIYTNLNIQENTLENLKQEMSNKMKAQKYVSFVNGKMSSNSEYMTDFLQENENYLKGSNFEYYTIENDEIIPSDIYSEEYENIEEIQIDIDNEESTELINNDEDIKDKNSKKIYKSASINDFEIYLTYDEEFIEESSKNIILENLNLLKPYKTIIYIAIPLSLIIFMIISLYLINSIGYTKGKDRIDINDFDKVPFEIVLCVFFICLGICLAMFLDSVEPLYKINMKTFITLGLSFYIINAVFLEIILITFIKRIKAKILLKTCLFGKVLIFLLKVIKKIFYKIKTILNRLKKKWNELIERIKYNKNLSLKFGIIFMSCIVIMFIIGVNLGPIGIIINLVIAELFTSWVFVRVQSFKKFEDSLKHISEGTLKERLNINDFSLEFKNSVEYLNNISNGFEKVIEENIKSERMKTELITNVSHDIKTPLTSIINYVDLLKKEDIDNEKAKEYLEILDSKSQRLKRLTEDLVEASKASSGNLKLDLRSINIVELINQAIGEFEDKFKENNLEIIPKFEKTIINIKADSKYMYRVVENLFSNVSKYALDSSRVYVDVIKKSGETIITIKNISKEQLNITEDELMQRFVRGDKSRATEGSGLGLAIAKSLVELQGGRFECKIDGDLFKVEIAMKYI